MGLWYYLLIECSLIGGLVFQKSPPRWCTSVNQLYTYIQPGVNRITFFRVTKYSSDRGSSQASQWVTNSLPCCVCFGSKCVQPVARLKSGTQSIVIISRIYTGAVRCDAMLCRLARHSAGNIELAPTRLTERTFRDTGDSSHSVSLHSSGCPW